MMDLKEDDAGAFRRRSRVDVGVVGTPTFLACAYRVRSSTVDRLERPPTLAKMESTASAAMTLSGRGTTTPLQRAIVAAPLE